MEDDSMQTLEGRLMHLRDLPLIAKAQAAEGCIEAAVAVLRSFETRLRKLENDRS